MSAFWLAAGSAAWLGLLTSISPCPLATNITALSLIARRIDRPRDVWLSGLLYTAGRMAAYVAIAALLVGGLLSVPRVAFSLQYYLNRALGPLLLLIAAFLFGWVSLPGLDSARLDELKERALDRGVLGAALLGVLFALSFCPVSAALFFGSLIPLSLKHYSWLALPACFGAGTGLPVVAAALMVAGGARGIGRLFESVAAVSRWGQRATGAVFVVVGAYYSWMYFLAPVLR